MKCIKNVPEILYSKIADIFKEWMNHGKVTLILLAVSLKGNGKIQQMNIHFEV